MPPFTKAAKRSNASRILRYIFRNQPVSRVGISKDLNISPAMVTTAVSSLIENDFVINLGEAEQEAEVSPGRKRLLIGLNKSRMLCAGVEFSEKLFSFCLTDLGGKVLDSLSYVPSRQQLSGVTQEIINGVSLLIERNNVDKIRIAGLGIAAPGQMDSSRNKLISLSHLWENFSPDTISQELELPVACENNVRCMAYGEYLFHPQSCSENFAFIHVGVGIFCANVIDGEIVTGSHNFISGEIGHTIINPSGKRCECGKYGCLQIYASESWLLKKSQALFENSGDTILRNLVESADKITVETILSAYELDDPVISSYIADAIKYLSISISNIAIVLGPQKIFLHGRLFYNENLRKELLDYVDRQLLFVQNECIEDLDILPFSSQRAAIGASAMAIDRLLIKNSKQFE